MEWLLLRASHEVGAHFHHLLHSCVLPTLGHEEEETRVPCAGYQGAIKEYTVVADSGNLLILTALCLA